MTHSALIFGSIGTLVETSKMQLEAFNMAFAEAGLDWEWQEGPYRAMLKQSGGRRRIAAYADKVGDKVDATALHRRKTEIFGGLMQQRGLQPRPGVLETMKAAKAAGMRIGFATTTDAANIAAIFDVLDGALLKSHFDFVGHAGLVSKSKPDPEIYTLALRRMDAVQAGSYAVEDTGISAQAAIAAGLECIGYPGTFSDTADFPAEVHLVSALSPAVLHAPDSEAA